MPNRSPDTLPNNLRREDAANSREALAWLERGNYPRARGWAEMLINGKDRGELIAHIAETMPAEHEKHERYWAEWDALSKTRAIARAKKTKKEQRRAS